MLMDGSQEVNRYNVVVDGKTEKRSVSRIVAESYILTLSESMQSKAVLVPVTNEGKEILFG
jgi:5S rRNA maturation endonuclease (ribonuclease M5)